MTGNTLKPDRRLVDLFLSCYESRSWSTSCREYPEQRQPNSVEAITTRSDGYRLAIEHTRVEPFAKDRFLLDLFNKWLTPLEQEFETALHGKIVFVWFPAHLLDLPGDRQPVVDRIRTWLQLNLQTFEAGRSHHDLGDGVLAHVEVTDVEDRVTRRLRFCRLADVDLSAFVDNCIGRKLPKLLAAPADHRVLMLERSNWKTEFSPQLILQALCGSELTIAGVEIWIAETISPAHTLFELWSDAGLERQYAFEEDRLLWSSDDLFPVTQQDRAGL